MTHHLSRCGEVAGLPARDRTLVMGIVNATPDSFSDGGEHAGVDAAIAHGFALVADGADVIDVGGESTRPGARRVPVDVEVRRVVPVIEALAGAGLVVSVDTTRAYVAARALAVGAAAVNDVSGGLADPDMARCVAEAGVPYVVMHWRAPSNLMQHHTQYEDVVADVVRELGHRIEDLVGAGVDPAQIVVDPGLGFAKVAADNWRLLARIHELEALGRPILVGASRKSFLVEACATNDGVPPAPRERDAATLAISALMAAASVYCVRVHSVLSTMQAVLAASRCAEARPQGRPAGHRWDT